MEILRLRITGDVFFVQCSGSGIVSTPYLDNASCCVFSTLSVVTVAAASIRMAQLTAQGSNNTNGTSVVSSFLV